MQHNVRSVNERTFMDGQENDVSYFSGFSGARPLWTSRRYQSAMALHSRRPKQDYHKIYTLPNGAKVTLEQLVIYLPLDQLFRYGQAEFSIQDIRINSLLAYKIALSYKQVRDALYRLNHSKLLFRHISKGIYTWLPQTR